MGTDLDLYNTYILLYDIYLTCLKGEVRKIRLRAIKKLKRTIIWPLKRYPVVNSIVICLSL